MPCICPEEKNAVAPSQLSNPTTALMARRRMSRLRQRLFAVVVVMGSSATKHTLYPQWGRRGLAVCQDLEVYTCWVLSHVPPVGAHHDPQAHPGRRQITPENRGLPDVNTVAELYADPLVSFSSTKAVGRCLSTFTKWTFSRRSWSGRSSARPSWSPGLGVRREGDALFAVEKQQSWRERNV